MFTLIIEDKHGGIADEYSFEDGEFYIGRSHTSDIILPSDNVSRRHARLYVADGKCYIEDLNSSNGVFVNGRRIHEVYQLQRSAQIKVGDYYLHIENDAFAPVEEEKTWCKLTGRNLAFTGQVFKVQRKVNLIGRGKDCTLTIIDPSVSRIHSKLSVERSGTLTLEDLKSSNGTFVNDERVEVATIQHRDIIRIGNVEFLVEMAEQTGTSSRPKERKTELGGAPVALDKGTRPAPALAAAQTAQKSAANPTRIPPPAAVAKAPPPVAAKPVEDDRHREAARPKVVESTESVKIPEFSTPPKKNAVAPTPAPKKSAFDDDWMPEKKGLPIALWLVAGGVVVALVVIVVILALKGPSVEVTERVEAPVEKVVTPTAEELELAAQKKKQQALEELEGLLKSGQEFMQSKDWDKALAQFEEVLKRDPLNDRARASLNRVKEWAGDKKRLEEARKLHDDLKRGEAARLLREIVDTSFYYAEAQDELRKLIGAKTTLELTVENQVRQKDCTAAIATLQEILLIDPKDPDASTRLEDLKTAVGTKRCAK